MVPMTVGDMLKVPTSLAVLPEETSTLLAGRVDGTGAGESWEPTVDRVEEAAVLDNACRPGHSDTG